MHGARRPKAAKERADDSARRGRAPGYGDFANVWKEHAETADGPSHRNRRCTPRPPAWRLWRWFMAKHMRKRDTSAGTTRKQTTSSKSRDPVRLQLIQQVQSGVMKPEEAEAQAKRLRIAPLIAQPDPEQFDPMNEVAWTLPMVAAWITFKSLDEVREWWTLIAVKFGIGGCLKRAAGSGSLHHHHPQHCPSCFFLMCQFPSIVSCGKLRRLAVQAGYERQARAREQTNAEKSRRSSGKT